LLIHRNEDNDAKSNLGDIESRGRTGRNTNCNAPNDPTKHIIPRGSNLVVLIE
jgi:hypothetical protein